MSAGQQTATVGTVVALDPVRDDEGELWTVEARFVTSDIAPTITFEHAGHGQRVTYLLSSILDAAVAGRGLMVNGRAFASAPLRIGGVALRHAAAARHAVPGSIGRFKVRWIPNDPEVPF
jgi:hypothetical protein